MAVWLDLLPKIHVPNFKESLTIEAHKLNDVESSFQSGVMSDVQAFEALMSHCLTSPDEGSKGYARSRCSMAQVNQFFNLHSYKCPAKTDQNSSKADNRMTPVKETSRMIVDGSLRQNNGALQFDSDDDDGSDVLEKYDLNFSQDSPDVITLSSKETLLTDSSDGDPVKEETLEDPKVEKSWSVLIITIVIGIVFLSLNLLVFGATFVQWYVISQRFKKGLCKSQNLSEANKSVESCSGIKPECSIVGGDEQTSPRLDHHVKLNALFKTGFRPSFNLSEALNHGFNFFPNSTNGTNHLFDENLQPPPAEKPSPNTPPLSSLSKCSSKFSTMKDLLPPSINPSERHRLTVRFSTNNQQQQQPSDPRLLMVRSDSHSEEIEVSRQFPSSEVELLRTDGQNSDNNHHQHINAQSIQVSGGGTIEPLESCPPSSIPGEERLGKSSLGLVKVLHKNVSTTV